MGDALLLFNKCNVPPPAWGRAIGRWGGLFHSPRWVARAFVAFAWGRDVCLGADGKGKVGIGVFFFSPVKWIFFSKHQKELP